MESTIPVKLLKFPNVETAFRFIFWVATEKKISNDQAANLLMVGAHGDTTLCSFRYVLVNAREFGRYVTHQSFVTLVANDASIFSPLIARNPCDATRSRHLFPKSLLGLNQ